MLSDLLQKKFICLLELGVTKQHGNGLVSANCGICDTKDVVIVILIVVAIHLVAETTVVMELSKWT